MTDAVAANAAEPVATDGEVKTEIAPVQPDEPVVKADDANEETSEQKKSRGARRLDRWRQRAIEAETRLRIQEESRQQQRPSSAAAPAPDAAPTRDQFDSYEEFVKAEAKHTAEKAAAEVARRLIEETRRRESEERLSKEQEREFKEWNAKLEAARDDLEDFDEVCSESDATITGPMAQAIKESEKGAHIAYFLAKNPGEATRIAALTPARQAAAILALEEKAAKPSKKPSKAPEPVNPVSKQGSPTNDLPSDKDDIDTWMRKERARMEKAGVRL